MKKYFLKSASLFAMCLLAGISTANADETLIRYYGEKAGLFRACKGELVKVCKEVITKGSGTINTGSTTITGTVNNNANFGSLNGTSRLSDMGASFETEEQAIERLKQQDFITVRYDGIDYVIPASDFNWEDGSINE